MQSDKEKFKKEFIYRLIKYSINIIEFCEKLRVKRNLCPIADQLIRSATSIGANIVEAKSSSSKKEYIKYFQISLKSANETKYWLILIKESDKIYSDKANSLLDETKEIANILGSSVLTLKGKK